MPDQLPDLRKIFERALEAGLEHGTDALVEAMVKKYNVTEDQVRAQLEEIFPKTGEFRATLKVMPDSGLSPWLAAGDINLTGGISFEIKRGRLQTFPQAFVATMPSGHTGIFMRGGPLMRVRKNFMPRRVRFRGSRLTGRMVPVRVMKSGRYAGKWREPIFKFAGPTLEGLILSNAMKQVFFASAVEAMREYFEGALK